MGLDWQKDRERQAIKAAPPATQDVDERAYSDWLVSRYNAPSKAELCAQANAAMAEWSRRKMPASIYDRGHHGQPMTLGNMRQNGVRSLWVECRSCRHRASVLVDMLPEEVLVPEAGERFKCSACGARDILTRPDWTTQEKRQ